MPTFGKLHKPSNSFHPGGESQSLEKFRRKEIFPKYEKIMAFGIA